MSFFRAGLSQANAVLADRAMVLRLVKLVVNKVDSSASPRSVISRIFSVPPDSKLCLTFALQMLFYLHLGNTKKFSV